MREHSRYLLAAVAVLFSGILLFLQLRIWQKSGEDYMYPVILFILTVFMWALLAYSISRYFKAAKINAFDSMSVSGHMWNIRLSDLRQSEPFIMFEVYVKNGSGRPLNITGLSGKILCVSQMCTVQPTLIRNVQITRSTASGVSVLQPVSVELKEKIIKALNSDEVVGFDFGGVSFTASADPFEKPEYVEIPIPFASCLIRGPFAIANQDSLRPLERVFADQTIYDQHGRKLQK